jgi:hypothetical protein
MKHTLLILSAAALLPILSSCTAYVSERGYVAARPAPYGYRPVPYRTYPASSHGSRTRYYDSRYRHPGHDQDRYYHPANHPRRHWKSNSRTVHVQSGVGIRL